MIQLEYAYAGIPIEVESDGEPVAADSLPTASLYRNGSASGVTVTIASTAVTGLYLASFTSLGTGDGWSKTDRLFIQATAVIGGTTFRAIVWNSFNESDAVMRGTDSASTHTAANVLTALGTGTWATAIPWNAAWDAEVQSEVNDALVALDLDSALIAQGAERAVNVDVNHRVHSHVYDMQANTITASALAADAIEEIQSGLATSACDDRLGYVLAALAGACADAGTAAETYTITIGADTFTIDHTGLDATGNRGTAVLTKS
jgi:hypothetical protein